MQKQNKYTIAATYKSNPFLEYFDQFFEIQTRPNNLQSLSDGTFLIEMSQLIKDFTLKQEIEENPKTFAQKLSNLKILYRSIESYWSDVLGIEIQGEQIDFIEISKSNNLQEIENLLELMIKTAVQAENKDFFIEKVLQTTSETQEFLKKIIEKVFKNHTRQSPRKQKQKRMYDKILELDHENDRLQSILYQICQQKMELQGKIKQLSDKLAEQAKQIQNYQCILHEDISTPQKARMIGFPDTSDRKQNLIDSLRKQIAEMAISHQRETQALCSQIQRITRKNQQFEKMKNQLTLSREIIDSHKEYLQQVKKMESELSHLRAEDMNKNNHLEYMKQKQQQANKMIVDLQTALTSSKAELQRKNIQIGELIIKLQEFERRFSPRKQHGNNLYFDFPDIINTQADAYIQTNRNLRQQLQRTRKLLQQTQSQLSTAYSSIQTLQGCQIQNRKLREMVLQLNNYRGQQNELLVSSLYHMRRMIQTRLC